MRVLVSGANGQLGRDLVRVFQAAAHEVFAYGHADMDITARKQVLGLVDGVRPDVVLNAAAYTDVERAEEDRDAAFRINEAGARNVAFAANACRAAVVHFSTDFVFDGRKNTPYEPDDPIAPLSVYGASKAAGEAAVREANPHHCIVRTAWLYGPDGNNFVEKILRAATERPELKIVEDEVGSPTHTWDLAQAAMALVTHEAYGTWHGANRGACSRYAFACRFLEQSGLETPVYPCASSEMPTKAERPRYSVLSPRALEEATGHTMRPWEEALDHYLQRRNTTS